VDIRVQVRNFAAQCTSFATVPVCTTPVKPLQSSSVYNSVRNATMTSSTDSADRYCAASSTEQLPTTPVRPLQSSSVYNSVRNATSTTATGSTDHYYAVSDSPRKLKRRCDELQQQLNNAKPVLYNCQRRKARAK